MKSFLDKVGGSCDDARMNDADRLRAAAKLLKAKNRRNKLMIQAHRAEKAELAASLKALDHPHTFPTRYKYG